MSDRSLGCKVAIVGAGKMAREHIRAFAAVPGVEIVGIHSRTRAPSEVLAAEYSVSGVYDSIAELYQETQADLVVVTVFETAMTSVSTACFEFPWTAMLEKPPGMNMEEAEEIHAAARARDRRVLVALNRRFLSSTRAALDDIGRCRGPRFINVQDQEDQRAALTSGQPQVVVDNWMYANSIHVIDYFQVFGRGKIKKVVPVVPWDPQEPGVVVSSIEFESGDLGLYQGIWNGPGPWAVSISTPDKRWEMRPLEQASFQMAGERQAVSVPVHHWDQDYKPGFRLQAEMAVAAAVGEPSDSPTLGESLETMRLLQAIFGMGR